MAEKQFILKYDPDTDILNVSLGKAKNAVSIEQEPEVYVRVTPKTNEVVGLTILGFKKSFLAKKQNISFGTPLAL